MAQKTIIERYDDLDGSEIDAGGGSVSFSLEGKWYEIDLSSKNLEKLRGDLDVYIRKGRRARTRGSHSAGPASEPTPVDSRAVRAWAEKQGLDVAPRGRLPGDLVEQYRAAH
ncbi:Lsr2 family protein [uncultured Friedmanniella sp.]|uniref:histone-like nucleoid-structuring protein Lsr2 n=1 Tax=uncultured Friedmanniella sp. TaxID=335381 RepID=UPI0035CC937F